MIKLEEHFQKMADSFTESGKGINSFREIKLENIAYLKGIKDAQAIKFTEWCNTYYFQETQSMWKSTLTDSHHLYSTSELYLEFLQNTKKDH